MFKKILLVFALSLLVGSTDVQAVNLHWSDSGERCWFQDRFSDDPHAFFVVDIPQRRRSPAYDPARLAQAFSKELKRDVDVQELKVARIGFADSPDQRLITAFERTWILDLNSYTLTPYHSDLKANLNQQLFLPVRKSQPGGESTQIHIENQLQTPVQLYWIDNSGKEKSYGVLKAGEKRSQHTFVNHSWLIKAKNGKRLGCFIALGDDAITLSQSVIDNVKVDQINRPTPRGKSSAQSPDGHWRAFLRDDQLWIKGQEKEVQLSKTASQDNTFGTRSNSPAVYWSPDSQYLVAIQTQQTPERTVHIVESTPTDQLQPLLKSFPYRKPGDDLSRQTVRLFKIEDASEIPVSQKLFQNQWSLRFLGWSQGSDRFRLLFNQRGHQTMRLLEVFAANGNVRTLIEEQSDTFIHYSTSGKSVLEELDSDEILWASERSGWNHLYRYSAKTGKVLNVVTTGDWNVRRINKIDREQKKIWFDAVGIVEGQDPYHEHFCSVNFDGTNLQVLTDGDGTHQIEFEQDGKYFVDSFSRVDMAPVEELRETATGKLICKLTEQKTAQRFQGRRLTERFVAKGRDGKTDIWGIIHWPKDFDPEKKYPVVENIYAGPHDHHVPKAFRSSYRHQYQIADEGMIVVQIDGMGTAWRSKEFHDVCFKNLRDAGFPDRIAWIKAAAKKFPQIDIERVGIYGGSAGGQNAMAALLWHNDFYKVAVSDCGCHDNRMDKIWWNEQWMGWPIDESYKQNSNMENAHLLKGKLMLIVGELDRNVDPATTTQVVHKLIKHEKDFEFVLVAGTGHGAAETPWASRKRLGFLKRHLLNKDN